MTASADPPAPPELTRRLPTFAEEPVTYVVTGVLLGAALVALLWVGSYARIKPTLGGIPFFYWYSVLWLLINAAFQLIAYRVLVARRRRRI